MKIICNIVFFSECDTGKVIGYTNIGFHNVHDKNISLLHDNTIARKINGEDRNGICFMDRPMRLGEKIYIRIAEIHPKWSSSMDFGLTSTNPNNISFSERDCLWSHRKTITDREFNYLPDYNDVLCISLKENTGIFSSSLVLSFSINEIRQPDQDVSISRPIWLVFDLYGKTRAIEISSDQIKTKPYNSFFREYRY